MTPERIEQERKAFEEWYYDSIGDTRLSLDKYENECYCNPIAEDMFAAWCAAKSHSAQSEWISAKDKLPEEKSRYLTCYVGSVARVCQFDGKKFSYWEYDEEVWEFVEVICIPDYWQPLPEPPETRGK